MYRLLIINLLIILPFFAGAQSNYEKYFTKAALRIDVQLAGHADTTMVFEQGYRKEPRWGGGPHNLISPLQYGRMRISVYDSASNKLIYQRGKSGLYGEWKNTKEATRSNRSFAQSFRMPYPKNPVQYVIEERRYATGKYQALYKKFLDPEDYMISNEAPPAYPVDTLGMHHHPDSVADIVVLPEGYTGKQMNNFVEDAQNMRKYLFAYAPFKQLQDKFNFYAIKAPSADSGTDIPGDSTYRHTLLNSSFYTFRVPRYLTSQDIHTIREIASRVSYDHIVVLVNSTNYGGGGFYNHLTLTTAHGPFAKEVSVHEFGHGFAGLGDEYYSSGVATSDFYNTQVEPWEPNLTTLVDFNSKWQDRISPGVPVPTPRQPKYKDTIGVFEGGGYVSKEIYSPYQDCRMKTNRARAFCPVCQDAIKQMIRFYTEQIR